MTAFRVYATDRFSLELPEKHPFPSEKYRLLRERLVAEGVLVPEQILDGPKVSMADLLRAHDEGYVSRMLAGEMGPDEMRVIGFPWSEAMVERSLRSCGSTLAATRDAARDGAALYLGGGTHHAFADRGQGFCVFNDVVVATRMLLEEGAARRIAVLDCDVHQGNGTAVMLRDEPAAFTFSIHGAKNFPRVKEVSDLDVALPCDTEDDVYLEALEPALDQVMDRVRPDFVFYLAGADPHEGDRFGRMKLSAVGLAARDAMVFERIRRSGASFVVTMAGGYGKNIHDTVGVQMGTIRALLASLR